MKCQEVLDYCTGNGLVNPYFYSYNGSTVYATSSLCTGMRINYNNGQTRYISVYGDANGDGIVNSNDQTAINNLILNGSGNVTNNAYFRASDIDFNGSVNVSDIMALKNYISSGRGTSKSAYAIDCVTTDVLSPDIGVNLRKMKYDVGVDAFSVSVFENKMQIINALKASTIFNYVGHGESDRIKLELSQNIPSLSISDINNLSNNCFKNCRFAYFTCCHAASGGENANNILHAIYNKGVRTVIGYQNLAYVDGCKVWAPQFYKYCGLGHTVKEAAFEANYHLLNLNELIVGNIDELVIFGDKSQRLAQPINSSITTYSVDNRVYDDFLFTENTDANSDNVKGYYNLSVLNGLGMESYSAIESRKEISDEVLSEYIDIEGYTYINEGYNESLGVYTLAYSKKICGINSSDSAFVMLNDSGNVIGVKCLNTDAFLNKNISYISSGDIENYIIQNNEDLQYENYEYYLDLNEQNEIVVHIILFGDEISVLEMPINS